jgi:Na+/proline symporter
MHWIDWAIMLVPFTAVLAIAVYTRRYARDVVDYLAAGRVAGRYVICVGDVATALSVQVLVGNCESVYRAGSAMAFWNILTMPLGMFLSLAGYCVYRWRASRALSFGQFLEMRYSHSFRVTAATIRNFAEMITNSISPAIAANFFIYFLGLPHKVHVLGVNLPCFAILVAISLTLALVAIWPAGRISLLVTDTFQGIVSYPIFVLIGGYVFLHFAWGANIEPVIMDRVPGESFVNPFDISKLRDFNMFALGVSLMATVLQRASWFGNDSSNSGRTPHEQKMAGVLGTWRNGFAWTMITMLTLLVITAMNHEKFVRPGNPTGFSSHETRVELLNKVASEVVPNEAVRAQIAADLAAIEPSDHRTIKDPVPEAVRAEHDAYFAALEARASNPESPPPAEPSPEFAEWLGPNLGLSQLKNLDTPYIDAVRARINANVPEALREEAEAVARGERSPSPELAAVQGANAKQAQKLRTVYGQMMLPAVIRQILPTGLVGLFALLMVMLLVSTDDSRIFNASSTWVQDVILPFFRKPPSSRQHIAILRWASVAVALFFFVVAVFFSQIDYINLFVQIMCAVWLGGGGTVMVFGLYSRFGNTAGAWCSIAFGSGFSLFGLIMQRTWAAHVVPWLSLHGWTEGVFRFFANLSRPFNPWVDWSWGLNSGESTFEEALQLFREKFFMNSPEIYGLSMVLSVIAYILGSWIARRFFGVPLFNLDRLLHRGEYADDAERERLARAKAKKVSLLGRIVGIDGEYTLGDKIIAWSVFAYSICYRLGLTFAVVLVWNSVSAWPKAWWGTYYYVTTLIVPIVVGIVSTVWFMWGGIRDGRRLFKDLEARVADASDNGFVRRDAP